MERRSQSWFTPFVTAFLLLAAALPAQQTIPYTDEAPVTADPLTDEIVEGFKAAALGGRARLSVYVADPETGVCFVDINANKPMKPASLLKLVTSAAALDTMGPDRTFVTTVETLGQVTDKTLAGDVIVVGGGDPSLGPRFQTEKPGDVALVLTQWAKSLRKRGIKKIEGNILGDDRRYEKDPLGIGWDPLEYGEWYSAEVSPLCFNDNCIDIIWKARNGQGELVKFELNPPTEYVTINSSVRVAPPSEEGADVRYFRHEDSNSLRARGSVPPGEDKYDYAAIHDPARYTAHLFMEALRNEGIKVSGGAFNLRDVRLDDDDGTSETTVLIHNESPPLSQILPIINGNSQNLYAELMNRETALEMGQPASFAGGARAVNLWLRKKELHRNGFTMVDGSGLSPVNRVPARMLANVLRYMANNPNGVVYEESMAVPGARSLRERFLSEKYQPLQRTLRAKTGYIEGVHTIAGYMTHTRGEKYIFVVMINDYSRRRSQEARDFLDDVVLKIQQSEVLP